jgi:hypothetical protein
MTVVLQIDMPETAFSAIRKNRECRGIKAGRIRQEMGL